MIKFISTFEMCICLIKIHVMTIHQDSSRNINGIVPPLKIISLKMNGYSKQVEAPFPNTISCYLVKLSIRG